MSKNSTGSAEKKYLSYQEQLEAQTKKLQAAWESLAQDASVNEFLTTTTKFVTFLVENLPTILKYTARLGVTMNAYKFPTLLGSMGSFIGVSPDFKKALGNAKGGIKRVSSAYKQNIKEQGFLKGFASSTKEENQKLKANSARRTEEYSKRFQEDSTTFKTIEQLLQNIWDKMSGKPTQQSSQETASGTPGQVSPQEVSSSSEVPNILEGQDNAEAKKTQEAINNEHEKVLKEQNEAIEDQTETIKKQSKDIENGTLPSASPQEDLKEKETAAMVSTIVAGTITNVMTTGTTHRNTATGETVESSEEAEITAKATTGVLSVGLGALGAWIGGAQGAAIGTSIGGVFGDILGGFLGGAIDKDRDEMNARVEEANESLSALATIKQSVSNIEKYSKSGVQSYEEYTEMISAIQDLKSSLIENPTAAQNIVDSLKGRTIGEGKNAVTINKIEDVYTLLNSYGSSDSETKSLIESMLNLGITKAQSDQTLASKEGELLTAKENLEEYRILKTAPLSSSKPSDAKDTVEYAHMKAIAERNGIPFEEDSSVLKNTKSISIAGEEEEYISNLEKYLNSLIEEKANAVSEGKETKEQLAKRQETIDDITKNINSYRATLAQIKSIYNDVNTLRAQGALLETQITTATGNTLSLVKANVFQLKQLGREEIFKAVAKQLQESGGLQGYSIYSEEGKSIIEKAIKSNETLYSVFTGQSYTLSEAIKASDMGVLQNFASALGVSIEELSSMQKQFGEFKLSEVTLSTTELREESETLTNMFSSLASSSGLTAENLEKIISTYPELIPYLSNSVDLGTQLLAKVEAYNKLYANSILSSVLGNGDYYTKFKNDLKDKDLSAYNALIDSDLGSATTAEQIQTLVGLDYNFAKTNYSFNGTEEQFKKIQQLYKENYTFSIEDVYNKELYQTYLSYITKMTDLEIENLNDQKEALEKVNEQRKYELDLMEAKIKLEDAQKEKKRVWREGVGWTYEVDQKAIKEAQDTLDELTNQKKISELEAQITELESYKERAEQISEEEELKNLRSAYESFLQSNGDSLESASAVLDRISTLYSDAKLILDGMEAAKNTAEAKESQFELIFGKSEDSYWNKVLQANRDVTNALVIRESEEEVASLKLIYSQAIQNYQDALKNYISIYDPKSMQFNSLTDEQQRYYSSSVDDLVIIDNAEMYIEKNGKAFDNEEIKLNASGTTNFSGGTTLINEFGTEAIVTPSGTITSLPSESGILPADITKNLWQLGELSPLIASSLIGSPASSSGVETKSYMNSTDESLNISSLIMQVSADQSFDVDAFADALRTRVALTKNNR